MQSFRKDVNLWKNLKNISLYTTSYAQKSLFFRQCRQYSAKKKLSKIGLDQKLINLPELVYYEKS